MGKFRLSILPLIIVNLLPVIGVIYWGWSLTVLVIIYWLENLIVGFFNILKMALSFGNVADKAKSIIFFCFHYGLFWVVHGLFMLLFLIPVISNSPSIGDHTVNASFDMSIKWVLLSLFLSHLFSFLTNFMRWGRALKLPPEAQMFLPYGRVMTMHILILGSAFLADRWSGSLVVLTLLITLKIIADVISHMVMNNIYYKER